MKKIATVIAIIVAFIAVGYVCWRYFDNNFKEYSPVAEMELQGDEELYFFKDSFATVSQKAIKSYSLDEDGNITEIYSEICENPDVVFSSQNYFVVSDENKCRVYSAFDGAFALYAGLDGDFISAHQFSDSLYVKVKEATGASVTVYECAKEKEPKNISAEMDFAFSDYCRDDSNGNEFFISYEASGEYIKLVIRIYNNDIQIKRIELDNVVYNDFDYISGMFVFYTDYSMFFINIDTLVRRTQNCYDIKSLDKFVYDDKIVYYWKDAFFDGVNNMFTVNKETGRLTSFAKRENVCAYDGNLIYTDGKYVKVYDFSGSLIDDNMLFSEDGIKKLGVMGDLVAAVKDDSIRFMKKAD